MKIVPNRTMRLGGRRVEFGKPVEVPEEDARLALRHGWAAEAPAKRASAAKADAAETAAAETAAAETAAEQPATPDAAGE